MSGRKKQERTISWQEWCREAAQATGIDASDIPEDDGELLERPGEDDDVEERDHDDELDEQGYHPLDPTTRGKPVRGTWNTTPPPNQDDKRHQRGNGKRGTRGGKADPLDVVEHDDKESRLRNELPAAIKALDAYFVTVRHLAPSGLVGIEPLGAAYRDFEAGVRNIDKLNLDQLESVSRKLEEVKTDAIELEKLLKKYPQANDLVVWAKTCPAKDFITPELNRKALDAACKTMSDALSGQPVNHDAYGTTCAELARLKALWDPMNDARQAFETAMSQLKKDMEARLKEGIEVEVGAIKDLVADIDKTCEPNTEAAFKQAAKLVPQLAALLKKCGMAQKKRAADRAELQERCDACRDQFKAARDALSGKENVDFKKVSKDQFDDLLASVKDMLKPSPREFNSVKTADLLGQMKHIVDMAQQRFDEMAEKQAKRDRVQNAAADQLEFSAFKYNDATTWVLQPVTWGKVPESSVNTSGADASQVTRISRGDLGDGSKVQTGRAYHCHMLNGGSGGISFAYNHLGGRRVQPVIYDYAVKRHENNSGGGGKYDWLLGGGKNNPNSAKLPTTVKQSRQPGSTD